MKKYLLKIEFRFKGSENSFGSTYRTKKNTIGIYETIEEAIKESRSVCEALEDRFQLNKNYNTKQRLSKQTHIMSNLGYIKTPFDFYLEIETLSYENINKSIDDIMEAIIEREANKWKI